MRAHIFQHLPFEGPGSIQPWLVDAGYEITYTYFFSSGVIPDVKDVDFLVIMGGSMSVNDEDKLPWLIREKEFIRGFIAAGRPVLGICLGSQMIASALGAKVFPNSQKEIGWFPVQGLHSQDPSIIRFPDSLTPLHWHGETFNLPAGAVQLAKSEACENQAFQIGLQVIGLQFHLEATRETLQDFAHHFRKELLPGKYIQTGDEILSVTPSRLTEMQSLMDKVLGYLTGKQP